MIRPEAGNVNLPMSLSVPLLLSFLGVFAPAFALFVVMLRQMAG